MTYNEPDDLFICKECDAYFAESDSHHEHETFCSTECETEYTVSEQVYWEDCEDYHNAVFTR